MKKTTILIVLCIVFNYSNLSAKKIEIIDSTNTSIIIPNVFSPNKDGKNDLFKIVGNFTALNVKIYNRYGELVYQSIQLNEGWNGRTTAGVESVDGTYFYIIEIETSEGKETHKGTLTLIR